MCRLYKMDFTSPSKKARKTSPDFSSPAFTTRRTPPKKKKRSRSESRSPTFKRTRRSPSRSPSPRSPDKLASLLSDAVAQVRVSSPFDLKALHAARVARAKTQKALAQQLVAEKAQVAAPTARSPRRPGESLRSFRARWYEQKK